VLVPTGWAMELPPGCYGRIAPRSGLAARNSIDVAAGVVDPDYRGEVAALLCNNSDEPFRFAQGDRIAQLVAEKYLPVNAVEVTKLAETKRQGGGFGSTGR